MTLKPEKKLTVFVFARGGSKGVKDKNIRMAGGKPLIAYAIAAGLSSTHIDRVIVSTDSETIAKTAKKHGAEILMRPPDLAADDTPETDAWRHAVDSFPHVFKNQNEFISLPPTTPLKNADDIDAALARYRHGDCDVVMGVTSARANPYFTMATVNPEGHLKICIEGSTATRRQDIPEVFEIIGGVYVTSPAYLKTRKRLIDGRAGCFVMPPERSFDIDTEFDLHLVDVLLKNPFATA